MGLDVNWITSAPANLMLMGEHSVVHGHLAIAAAIKQRLTIYWSTRADTEIHIESALGTLQTNLNQLYELSEPSQHSKLNWVIACLKHYQSNCPHGLNIRIVSEFKATLGLGSSAALLAAMIGGLDAICQKNSNLIEKFKTGLKIIHQLQGRGSGADLAVSLNGGLILFNPQVPSFKKLNTNLDLQLIYCGYKMPTVAVLKFVYDKWQTQPAILNSLYQLMGQTTQATFIALQQNKLDEFYNLVNAYQGLMDALGVNDATLAGIIYQSRQLEGVYASKISGSGLGDCVLNFGKADDLSSLAKFNVFDIEITQQGLVVETFA